MAFDADTLDALWEAPEHSIPINTLFNLPRWCVYIETPGHKYYGRPLAGFFTHLEYDYASSAVELRFLLNVPSGPELFGVHLVGCDVRSAVEAYLTEGRRSARRNRGGCQEGS